jgi:MFS family permease
LRGRYIGAASAMFGLGSAIGPIVGLALWDRIGSSVWWVLALAELAGIALAWVGIRPSALRAAPERDAQSPAIRSAAARARDWWPGLRRAPRAFSVVERLIGDRADVWRQIEARSGLRDLVGKLLITSVTSLALYGAVLGVGGGFAQTVSSAIKLPLLFLATLAICLPALYLFGRLLGLGLSLIQATALTMIAITVTAVSALSLAPVNLFAIICVHSYLFVKLLNVAILLLASVVGLSVLGAGLAVLSARPPRTTPRATPVMSIPGAALGDEAVPQHQEPVPVTAPTGDSNGAAADATRHSVMTIEWPDAADPKPDDATSTVVRAPLRASASILLYMWIALFGLVGTQLGWTLRPFVGGSGQPFSVVRQEDGTFVGDVSTAVGRLFGG